MVDIDDQPGQFRLPPQQFLRSVTGGWDVHPYELLYPSKVLGCFLGSQADYRHIQATANHVSDLFERDAFVCDCVIGPPRSTLLERKPVDPGSIKPMYRRPAVKPFPYIGRHALLAC